MKRPWLASFLLLASCIGSPAPRPNPSDSSPLKLDKVVMLMRHGIRPPTKAVVVPAGYSQEQWPAWPVDFGLLTPRGAEGVKLLGARDRVDYRSRGLLADGCPPPGTIVVKASEKERAIATARSWIEGFMPGCAMQVSHPTTGDDDKIFHGLGTPSAPIDGQRALDAAVARLPAGGLTAETDRFRGELTLLARVIDCTLPGCPLLTQPSRLVAQPSDRPDMEGPLDVASTASQTLLMEYLEGLPMNQVGWGRVSRGEIEQLLRFHPLKFRYSNRPEYIAAAAAAPIVREIVAAFDGRNPARVTLLAGHDTNVADLGGRFDLHWRVPSYPADEIPPGSALGFELLSDSFGDQYVRAFYRAQTMDQLRHLVPLDQANSPSLSYLPIPGCGNSAAPRACRLNKFVSLSRVGP